MMRIMPRFLLVVLSVLILAGCATSRGVVDVSTEDSINPEAGQSVKFVQVVDERDFMLNPPQADIPSLKNGEINDASITARAIARKRNGYGKALGDILLPENKTVMDVVENRLSKGFRESGYRVLEQGDYGYEDAMPIAVDINEFWGWFSPGFWSISINFKTSVNVSAPESEFSEGVEFDSSAQEKFQVASGKNWKKVINQALDQLSEDIEKRLSM